MKIGQEISHEQSQELKASLTANLPEGSEAHQLLTGMSTSIWNTVFQAFLNMFMTKMQDPDFQKTIMTFFLGLFTPKS